MTQKISALDDIKVGNVVMFSETISSESEDFMGLGGQRYTPSKLFALAGQRGKILEVVDAAVYTGSSRIFTHNNDEEPPKKNSNHTAYFSVGNNNPIAPYTQVGQPVGRTNIMNVTEKLVRLTTESGYTFTMRYADLLNVVDKVLPDTEATKVLYAKS